MSKIIAIAVLITLTLLPFKAVRTASPSIPANGEREVTVLFSGLMVFHFNQAAQAYEVGVLSEKDSHGHKFCIRRRGAPYPTCREDLPSGNKWTLSVTNPPGGDPMNIGHDGKRRPDHEEGQYDFSWIVDLEAEEFHGKVLDLEEGHLKPIIQLPKASLFAKYKSPDLIRWKGEKPADPKPGDPPPPVFGFVAESIGFSVKLKPGDSMVLTDDSTGKEIFRVDYAPPSPGGSSDLIEIMNVRKSMTSHFKNYYRLFKGIAKEERFDFAANPGKPPYPKIENPKNPVPRYRTCCDLMCTLVLLGKRTDALH